LYAYVLQLRDIKVRLLHISESVWTLAVGLVVVRASLVMQKGRWTSGGVARWGKNCETKWSLGD